MFLMKKADNQRLKNTKDINQRNVKLIKNTQTALESSYCMICYVSKVNKTVTTFNTTTIP
jgi:hypothetical protein